MPISRNEGETRDEFVSRCVSKEMNSGKPQDQALAICLTYADEYFRKSSTQSVSDATWSTESPININLKTYRDYPQEARNNAQTALDWAEKNGWGDCGTPVGKARANQLANGEGISEETIARMASFERQRQNSTRKLGEGCGRLVWLAWGGDAGIEWASRKLKEIRRTETFKKVNRVLFNEDFDVNEVRAYKEMGFKVYVRSSRKIKKADKKVWNKLKEAKLTEDNLVFGEVKELDKKFNFDLLLTGEDAVLEMLSVKGQNLNPKRVLKSIPVSSIEEAEKIEEEERKSIDLKFAKISFLYKYEEIPGIPPAESGSRTFCKRMLANDKFYTLEEIKSLSNEHLKKMFAKYAGLEPDVFLYRGGFYRLPGTLNTTPYCRHQWTLKIVMN
jgi:hypothetical protein